MENNKYKVSVITPFHDVDLNMFKKTFESMKNQTIGFINIEWIIVMHNCKNEYIDSVSKIVAAYDNIILKILNNDKNTASSPRNHGLKFCTSPYVSFLDGDDTYTPDCLKIACKEILDNNADIVLYRMEYELDDELSMPVPDIELYNQCEERIIIDKNNWDYEKMFSGLYGLVTNRLFDRKFLIDNNLYFDEDLIFCEDFHMFTRAMVAANRLVYLPQTIGYHYYINKDSTIQSKKSGDTLVEYAKGLEIFYDLFDKYNIPKYFMQYSATVYSDMIMRSDSITLEQRETIKKYIGRFIEKFEECHTNKIISPELSKLYCRFPKSVILDTKNEIQDIYIKRIVDGEVLLASIIRKNVNTDYGIKYNFSEIKTIDKYINAVPIISHEKFQKMIKLQIGIGEKNIFCAKQPLYYFINEANEYIPCTKKHFKSYLRAYKLTFAEKKNLFLSARKNIYGFSNDGALVGDMESILLTQYFTKKHLTLNNKRPSFTSSIGRYFDEYKNEDECYYVLMRDALLDRTLEQIVAISAKNVLKAFEVLENNIDKMLDEISHIDKDRYIELKEIFVNGFNMPVASKIWRKLEKIIAFGVGENFEYLKKLKKYTGNVVHNNGFYYTEEAILGVACDDESDLFEKSTYNDEFYELISIKDGKVHLFSQTEIGESYQLVITNNNGLYRYETNHFIRIQHKEYSKIYFTIY